MCSSLTGPSSKTWMERRERNRGLSENTEFAQMTESWKESVRKRKFLERLSDCIYRTRHWNVKTLSIPQTAPPKNSPFVAHLRQPSACIHDIIKEKVLTGGRPPRAY